MWDLLQAEGHSLVMGLEAWQLCGGETSPESPGGATERHSGCAVCGSESAHTHAYTGSIGPSCDKWL